jgi:hypothetical protein
MVSLRSRHKGRSRSQNIRNYKRGLAGHSQDIAQ